MSCLSEGFAKSAHASPRNSNGGYLSFYFMRFFLCNSLPPPAKARITQWVCRISFMRPSSHYRWPSPKPSFCCCGLLLKMKPGVCLPVTAVTPLSFCRSALGVVDRCIYKTPMWLISIGRPVFHVICGRCNHHLLNVKQSSRKFFPAHVWSLF